MLPFFFNSHQFLLPSLPLKWLSRKTRSTLKNTLFHSAPLKCRHDRRHLCFMLILRHLFNYLHMKTIKLSKTNLVLERITYLTLNNPYGKQTNAAWVVKLYNILHALFYRPLPVAEQPTHPLALVRNQRFSEVRIGLHVLVLVDCRACGWR